MAVTQTTTPDDLNALVNRNIKLLMTARGIDHIVELAKRTGQPTQWFYDRMGSKRVDWKLNDLLPLAQVFGVEPSDLLRPPQEVAALTRWIAGLAVVQTDPGQLNLDDALAALSLRPALTTLK